MRQLPDLAEIKRVIPVLQSQKYESGRIDCVSLELYDDGAFVNFWVYGVAPESTMFRIRAVDNLGHRFRAIIQGGSGRGQDYRWRMGYSLDPAIKHGTEWLELSVRIETLAEDGSIAVANIDKSEDSDRPAIFRIPIETPPNS